MQRADSGEAKTPDASPTGKTDGTRHLIDGNGLTLRKSFMMPGRVNADIKANLAMKPHEITIEDEEGEMMRHGTDSDGRHETGARTGGSAVLSTQNVSINLDLADIAAQTQTTMVNIDESMLGDKKAHA